MMDSSEEEDIFSCGRCKKEFYKMEEFLSHKKKKVCKRKGESSAMVSKSAYDVTNKVEVVESAEDGIPADLFEETLSANGDDSSVAIITEETCRSNDVIICPFCSISCKGTKELPVHFAMKHNIPEEKAPIIIESFRESLQSEQLKGKGTLTATFERKQRNGIGHVQQKEDESLSETAKVNDEKNALMKELGLSGSTSSTSNEKNKSINEITQRCDICETSYKSPANLKVHLKSKGHKGRASTISKETKQSEGRVTSKVATDVMMSKDGNSSSGEDDIVDVDTVLPDEEGIVKKSLKRSRKKICHICKLTFPCQTEIVQHLSTVHSQYGRGKRSRKASMKLRMNTSESEEYKEDSEGEGDGPSTESKRRVRKEPGECQHCGKLIPAKAFTVHVRRCNNKLKYQCVLCKHQSRERYDFNIHIDHHKVWWNMSEGSASLEGSAREADSTEDIAVVPVISKEKSSDHGRRDALFGEELGDTTLSEVDLAALGLMPRSKLEDQKKQELQQQEHTYASQEEQRDGKHPMEDDILVEDVIKEDSSEGESSNQKSGGSRLKCHPCDKWFHRSVLPDHMLKLHNMKKVFQCRDVNCLGVFDVLSNFVKHISSHSSEPMFQCGCTTCKKGNPVGGEIDYSAAIKRLKMKNYYKKLIYKCTTCWARFPSQVSLDKHIQTDTHNYPCQICGKLQNSKSQYRSHMLSHQQTHKFLCEHCGKGFRVQRDLVKHVASHSGDKPFACSQCDKRFVFKAKLDRHFTTVHSLIKPFVCSEEGCDKAFTRKDKLKDHMYTHRSSPPFKCSFCPKGFYRKDNLRDHEVYHTRQYKYKCSKCSKGFMRPKALNQHFTSDHPVQMTGSSSLNENFNLSGGSSDVATEIRTTSPSGGQSCKQSDFAGFSALQIDQQVLNKGGYQPGQAFAMLPQLQRGTEMSRSSNLIGDMNSSVNALVQILPPGTSDVAQVTVQSSQGLSIPIQSPSAAASSQYKYTQEKLEQVTRQIQAVTQQLIVQQLGGELLQSENNSNNPM